MQEKILTDEYNRPAPSMQRKRVVAAPLMTTQPGSTGRISIRPAVQCWVEFQIIPPWIYWQFTAVWLTVQSWLCRALDQALLGDQQVQSWTGSIQVPEPDDLLPAWGEMRPLIQQRQGQNASTEQEIGKGDGEHDKENHVSTNPLGDVLLWSPVCCVQWFRLYCAF